MSAKKRLGSDPFSDQGAKAADDALAALPEEAPAGALREEATDEAGELAWLDSASQPAEPVQPEPKETVLPAQQVLEGLNSAACLIAADQSIIYVNQALAGLLDCPADDLLGLHWEEEVMRPLEGAEPPPAWEKVLAAREALLFRALLASRQGADQEMEVRCWLLSGGAAEEAFVCAMLSPPKPPVVLPDSLPAAGQDRVALAAPPALPPPLDDPALPQEVTALLAGLLEKNPELKNGGDLPAEDIGRFLQDCTDSLGAKFEGGRPRLAIAVESEPLAASDILLLGLGFLGLWGLISPGGEQEDAQVEALVDRDHRGRPRLRFMDHDGVFPAKLKLKSGKEGPLAWLIRTMTARGGGLLVVRGPQTEYRITLAE
ncbi:hypothetical protein AAU61_16630 [Desulfocarbo indianensis]|nr:hypothetical protein AAU61_16630 [Desulfocarbo indianensis]